MRRLGHVGQHQPCTALGDDRQPPQFFERIAQLARIAHVDREALQALDGFADVLAADCRGDDRLHIGDVHAIARSGVAADVDIDIASAGQPFRQCARHARHVL